MVNIINGLNNDLLTAVIYFLQFGLKLKFTNSLIIKKTGRDRILFQ